MGGMGDAGSAVDHAILIGFRRADHLEIKPVARADLVLDLGGDGGVLLKEQLGILAPWPMRSSP
jgi:hypothetical protein